MDSSSRKDWIKMLPGLAISAISLIVIFYFVDLDDVLAEIRRANYLYLALGVSCSLTWLVVRAIVWRGLLADLPRYNDVFFAVNEGYLLNTLLPLRVGEVGRAFLLGRKPLVELVETAPAGADPSASQNTLGFWRTMSSVVVERVLDMAFGVMVLLISLPFVINMPWGTTAAQATAVMVTIGLGVLYWMGRYPQQAMAIFERLTTRIAFARRLTANMLPRLLEGLAVFQDWKRFVRVVAWMALNWALGLVSYWLYIRAFFPDAPLLWASFTLGAVAVGGTIPSSPGNIGVQDGVIVAALSVFNGDQAAATACAILLHLAQLILAIILGGYGISREGETLMGIYRQLRNRS